MLRTCYFYCHFVYVSVSLVVYCIGCCVLFVMFMYCSIIFLLLYLFSAIIIFISGGIVCWLSCCIYSDLVSIQLLVNDNWEVFLYLIGCILFFLFGLCGVIVSIFAGVFLLYLVLLLFLYGDSMFFVSLIGLSSIFVL